MLTLDYATLAPKQRIDIFNYNIYLQELTKLLEADPIELIVDLSEVTFLDTYGLGVLVKGWKLAQDQNTSFRVTGVKHPAVELVFEVTKLQQLFPIQYQD
ncbi:MAG: STAS domain-containing protein [Pseudanabaenaceae cyanobacterium]